MVDTFEYVHALMRGEAHAGTLEPLVACVMLAAALAKDRLSACGAHCGAFGLRCSPHIK